MKANKLPFSFKRVLSIFTLALVIGALLIVPAAARTEVLVDFEGGLPGGWFDFAGGGASVTTSALVVADTDPLARPGQVGDNTLLEATFDATVGFAGFGQDFSVTTGPQDWINFTGVSFWMYGFNSGNTVQFEILDNRSDPTTDTAERFDTLFTDDFTGWQQVIIPFSDFTRATDFQPPGTPDDGLTLTEMWGWAVPLDGSAGTLILDDVGLEQAIVDDFESGLPTGTDGDGIGIGFITFSDGSSSVALTTTDTPPAPVPDSDPGNNVLQVDTNVVSGGFAGLVHAFENEAVDTWTPQDWSAFSGFSFWLYGNNTGSTLFVDILDNRNPGSTTDDAERFSIDILDDFSGWQFFELPWEAFSRKEIGNGAPNDGFTLTEVHGWAFGVFNSGLPFTNYIDDVGLFGVAEVPELAVTFAANNFDVDEGLTGDIVVKLNRPMNEDDPAQVSVDYTSEPGLAIPGRDYTPPAGTLTFVMGGSSELSFPLETFDDNKYEDAERVILRLSNPVDVTPGFIMQASGTIVNNDSYNPLLLDDFERFPYLWDAAGAGTLDTLEIAAGSELELPGQGAFENVLSVLRRDDRNKNNANVDVIHFGRRFALGQDWSQADGLAFWFYGNGTGDEITVNLSDNQRPDPGPRRWRLAWSDEFNGGAGMPPDPAKWTHEIGDGTVNGIPGWGNAELQYYTDGVENAVMDGRGSLVITADEADSSLTCYYGPCEYTSSRIISWYKAEFAYGRIEAKVKVPAGEGLWPAFWSLGTDIDLVGWPQTGEIDIMEFVGREPFEVFGTIHGPGYAGGASYGDTYTFPTPVYETYHTFVIEWQPDLIEWYVDGILYHTATPADVAPNEWVFNDPVFLLFNLAVGGNFGGPVGEDTIFPATMKVDYVHVYQPRDTAERFEATFVDDFVGWQQVEIPFTAFERSRRQLRGAPNDGLTLSEVWGYGFRAAFDDESVESLLLDQVRLLAPSAITVTNTNDSGAGSLRQAIDFIASGGTVSFDPSLAGGTITLTSGPLAVSGKTVTVDGADAPGLTISGGGADRVLITDPGSTANISHLILTNGYGWQLAGGILNNGTLTLDHAMVISNTMATDAGDFWQGGGGIYNGEGATLNLIDSTVSNNISGHTGGGIYSFFNTTTSLVRSTVSDNVALDVGGGLRTLGNVTIENSTISGNTSTAWHGGGAFITDGVVDVTNTTVTNNNAPGGTTGGLFVGTFTDADATLNLQNTIVASNGDFVCFLAPFGSGTVAINSLGNNVFTDGTCNPIGSDQIVGDAGLGSLADNGGPTLTHALLAGSPAIDAANPAVCPPTDQRGVPRDATCDVGAYEYVP